MRISRWNGFNRGTSVARESLLTSRKVITNLARQQLPIRNRCSLPARNLHALFALQCADEAEFGLRNATDARGIAVFRRKVKREFLDIESTIRQALKAFGIRLAGTSRMHFEQARRVVETLLQVARSGGEVRVPQRAVSALYTDPGFGPVTALSFMIAIDDPSRLRRSREAAAYLGF